MFLPLLLLATASSAEPLSDAFASLSRLASAAAARPSVVVDAKATGAWYRKLSSPDAVAYDGITAHGTLPRPTFDSGRLHAAAPGEAAWMNGPLDSPSVYLGAHADGREVDAGLKWDHVYDSAGRDTGRFGWRLFWRVASPGGNSWHNAVPGSPEDVVLAPGARFAMTLRVRPDGTARFDVREDGGAAGGHQVFALDGFWDAQGRRLPRRFKRVAAIDQFREDGGRRVGNEHASALPTNATVAHGRWEFVTLLGAEPAPLTGRLAVDWRGSDEASGYPAVFPVSGPDARGGEPILIFPPSR